MQVLLTKLFQWRLFCSLRSFLVHRHGTRSHWMPVATRCLLHARTSASEAIATSVSFNDVYTVRWVWQNRDEMAMVIDFNQ